MSRNHADTTSFATVYRTDYKADYKRITTDYSGLHERRKLHDSAPQQFMHMCAPAVGVVANLCSMCASAVGVVEKLRSMLSQTRAFAPQRFMHMCAPDVGLVAIGATPQDHRHSLKMEPQGGTSEGLLIANHVHTDRAAIHSHK